MRKINKITSILICMMLILFQCTSEVYASGSYIKKDGSSRLCIRNADESAESYINKVANAITDESDNGSIVYDTFGLGDNDGNNKLPPSCDLSTLYYVPESVLQIGGTCGSFAPVYFQYSYEVNKKLGNAVTDSGIRFSPYYSFSYSFTGINNNYRSLMERGCITWDEWTGAGVDNEDETALLDCKDITAMRNALNVRLSHYYDYVIKYDGTETEQDKKDKLNEMKALLANGYMLVSDISANIVNEEKEVIIGDKTFTEILQNTDIMYRHGKGSDGYHRVAIIGYNDNYKYDINKDGNIESWESGAFKVRNSWGPDYHGKGRGDFYVMYDTVVNDTTMVSTVSESIDIPDVRMEPEAGKYCVYVENEGIIDLATSTYDVLNKIPCLPIESDGKCERENFRDLLIEVWNVERAKENTAKTATESAIDTWFENNRTKWQNKLTDFENDVAETAEVTIDENGKKHYDRPLIPSNWDEVISCYMGTRRRAFSGYADDQNVFNFIKVEEKDVQLVGQVDYTLDDCSSYKLTFSREGGKSKTMPNRVAKDNRITATEVFDLTELISESRDLLNQQRWKVIIELFDKNKCSDFNFTLTDKNGTIIPTTVITKTLSDTQQESSNEQEEPDITQQEITLETNLKPGDNDYDTYLTTADFEDIRYYLMGCEDYTPLQKQLFDCNSDGKVDNNDICDMLYTAYQAVYSGDTSFVNMTKDEFYSTLVDFGYVNLGDVTCDGIINVADVKKLQSMLAGTESNPLQKILGDVNKDGKLDREDLAQLSSEMIYVDVNYDNRYTAEDIYLVHDYLLGDTESLTVRQQREVDLNANGVVDTNDFYILVYAYHINLLDNPDFSTNQFFDIMLPNLNMSAGDMDTNGTVDENDYQLLKNTLEGNWEFYLHPVLADTDKNGVLDERDLTNFEENYLSNIPFTYTLDETAKTMTIAGVKDNTVTCIKIPEEYTVNCEKYQVTGIAENAFSECSNLEEIYIPDSITNIAGEKMTKSPFYGISGYVLRIYCEAASAPAGYGRYWAAGQRVTYGYTMKNIEDYFYYTADTEHKTLTITEVKGNWYNNNNGDIIIDDRYLLNGEEYRVTAIDDYAFYYVGLGGEMRSVELPAGITSIGEWAFADNEYLEYIDLGRSIHLREIKASAFAYCSNLIEIWIPGSVEVIYADTLEDSLFYECDEELIITVGTGADTTNWGAYWNYLSENNIAETYYQ